MKEDRLALSKAVDSGDTDMSMCLRSLLREMLIHPQYILSCFTSTRDFLWAHFSG